MCNAVFVVEMAKIKFREEEKMQRLKSIGFVVLMVVLGIGISFADMDDDLSSAAGEGKLDEVKALVKKGADVDSEYSSGRTALIMASANGHFNIVKYLISKGAKVDAKDNFGYNALCYAASHGHLNICKYLIKKGASRINEAEQEFKGTKLMWYAGLGYSKTVASLISKGADINKTDTAGNTALFYAIKFNNLKTVKYLIKKGANVKKQNYKRETPLHWAIQSGNVEIVKYLIKKGARVYKEDRDGKTPLHYALNKGNLDMVKYLVSKGADIDVNQYNALLYYAVKYADVEIVKYLVAKGADVNAKGEYDYTPLHDAVDRGNLDMVKMLLELGADVTAKNRRGDTPIELARKQKKTDIVECILKAEKEAEARRIQVEKEAEEKRILEEKEAEKKRIHAEEKAEKEAEEKRILAEIKTKKELAKIFKAIDANNLSGVMAVIENDLDDIDVQSDDNLTPLLYAISKGKLDIVKYLVKKGADYGLENKKGQIAWEVAYKAGHKKIAKYLYFSDNNLTKSLDGLKSKLEDACESGKLSDSIKTELTPLIEIGVIDVDNSEDGKYLHTAAFYGYVNMVGFLVNSGANVNAKTKTGSTPLHLAAKADNLDIVEYLVIKGADVNIKNNDGKKPVDLAKGKVKRYLKKVK